MLLSNRIEELFHFLFGQVVGFLVEKHNLGEVASLVTSNVFDDDVGLSCLLSDFAP